MKKEKERLRWLLSFIYVDINSLSRMDFFRLLVDLGGILSDPVLLSAGNGRVPLEDSEQVRREIKKLQKFLKEILDALKLKGKGMKIEVTGESLEDLGKYLDIFPGPFGKTIASIAMTHRIFRVKDKAFMLPVGKRDNLLIQFMLSLKPFSLNDIKECERHDCGKYFLKATQKEKRYCSKRCMWVIFSRNRRTTDPKKERGKKRELGPNIKIQAKKRKEE